MMLRMAPAGGLWLLLNLFASLPASAQTEDGSRVMARDLGARGIEAFQAGDYKTAEEKLSKAYSLLPAPTLGLWLGRALAKQNKLLAASEQLLAATKLAGGGRDVALQNRARADAERERNALLPRIPGLVVRIEGAGTATASVSLDGAPLAAAAIGERVPVEPGEHEVVAREGERSASSRVVVLEGEQKEVSLRLSADRESPGVPPVLKLPPSSSPPSPAVSSTSPAPVAVVPTARFERSPQRTYAWVALGAGAVGVATGVITGVVVLKKKSDIENSQACENFRCLPPMRSTVDSYNTFRAVSSIGFIAGGALAALGLGLYLTAPASQAKAVGLGVGPSGLHLNGAF
jgi:hypothetical protein